jgi:lysophospholipid acyltransferase (LPLAT)-like uncharacterized protein
VRGVLGFVLGLMVRAWVATLRLDTELLRLPRGPLVVAFAHGQQMLLLAARRRLEVPGVVLVSRSRDGELQSGVMRALGFEVVRGSSSRGASAGLRGLIGKVRRGRAALIAVDGPRGPAGVAKPGALFAARHGGAALVPVAARCSATWTLERTWDRFRIPLPFSRVAVVSGPPVGCTPGEDDGTPDRLSAALVVVDARARGRRDAAVRGATAKELR